MFWFFFKLILNIKNGVQNAFFPTVHLSVEDTFYFSNHKNTDSSQLYNL